MNLARRIEFIALLAVMVIGLLTSLAKSAGELRKPGEDSTVSAADLPVPGDATSRPANPEKMMMPTRRPGSLVGVFSCLAMMLASGACIAATILRNSARDETRILIAGLSVPLGLGLHSAAAFVLMLAGRLDQRSLIFSVPLLSSIAALIWWRSREKTARVPREQSSQAVFRDVAVFLAIILLCSAGHVLKRLGGDWDALFFWNARAASILTAGHDWRWAYDGTIDVAYNDYPLCLPLAIAIGWSYAGQMTFVVPLTLSLLALFSLAAIIYAGVGLLTSEKARAPLLSALLLLGLPALYRMVAGQRADLLLMSAMSGAVVVFMLALRSGEPLVLGFSLALAACAAWTKNEGLAFLGLTIVGVAVVAWRRGISKEGLLRGGLPALPILGAIIALKLQVSSANDLWTFAPAGAADGASILQRSSKIALSVGRRMLNVLYLPYLIVAIAVIRRAGRAVANAWPAVAVLLAMALVYFGVFLTTPRDLDWHLDHAEKRLLVHLWPVWVLLLGMSRIWSAPAEA